LETKRKRMSKEYDNPVFQSDKARVPPSYDEIEKVNEKTALLVSDGNVYDTDVVIEEVKPSCFQRHFKKLIALGICLLVLVLLVAVAVPQGIKAFMGKVLREAQIEIDEMEITSIVNGTAYCRIQGTMTVNVPLIQVEGTTQEAYFDLLIPDPQDRSVLEKIGTVYLPPMYVQGTTVNLNVSTYMILVSDRLFHEFLSDVLENATVTAYMDGIITITAKVPVYGPMTVTERLLTPVSIDGMNGLDFDLLSIDLDSTTNDTVSLWFELLVYNPSQFYCSSPLVLYNVNIRLYYEGVFIGLLWPQNLLIGKGESFNVAIGELIRTPLNEPSIADFLSLYLMGEDVPIEVNGTAKVDIGLEQNPFYPARIYVDWIMPGIASDLVEELYAPLSGVNPLPPIEITASGLLVNPLDFDVEFTEVEFDGYAGDPCNRVVSHVLESYANDPLLVPSKTPICVDMLMAITVADLNCMLAGLSSEEGLALYIQNGVFGVKLGEFYIDVFFEYGPVYAQTGKCPI